LPLHWSANVVEALDITSEQLDNNVWRMILTELYHCTARCVFFSRFTFNSNAKK
jgi:hypothetical protein